VFKEVIGHERIIEMLRSQIRLAKVAGAYLFAGPEGVGKRLVAMTFAKALNCLQLPDDSCDVCISCRKIDDGNHPDVQVIKPSGNWLKIDQIRAMQRRASFRAMEGRYKVFIILKADRMTDEAANSMLKTLEEPPSDTVFILVATDMSMILPTVLSRCQLFRFHRIPRETIKRALRERFLIGEATAARIALLCEGRVEKALKMAEDPGSIEDEEIPRVLKGMERLEIFKMAEELSSNPEKLDWLLTWYRDLMLVKEGVGPDRLTHPENWGELRENAGKVPGRRILEAIRQIMLTRNMIRHNINAMLAMEVLCLRLRGMENV